MFDREVFTALAVLLQVAAFALYLREILLGQVRPHVFSWLLWSLLIGVGAAAQWHEGAGLAVVPLCLDSTGCLFFALLSLRYGEARITRGDWAALMGGLLAIPLWLLTSDPVYAVLLVTAIDAIGLWPTFRKSWAKPDEESALFFGITATTMSLALAGLPRFTFVSVFYPAAIVAMNLGFVVCLLTRRAVLARRDDKGSNIL